MPGTNWVSNPLARKDSLKTRTWTLWEQKSNTNNQAWMIFFFFLIAWGLSGLFSGFEGLILDCVWLLLLSCSLLESWLLVGQHPCLGAAFPCRCRTPSARRCRGPWGTGMTWDGCQEARCQERLRCTGFASTARERAVPGWLAWRELAQPCMDFLSYLVASGSLQAEDGAGWHPAVVAAFWVLAWGVSPTQGRSPLSCCPALVAHLAEAARSKQALSFLLQV